eukprot:gene557-303_t
MRKRKHPLHFVSPRSQVQSSQLLFCQGAGGMGALWVRRHFLKAPRSKWIILFYGFFARLQMASSGQVRGLQLGGGARGRGGSVEQVGPRQPQHQSGSQKAACPHQWLLRFFNSLAQYTSSFLSLSLGLCLSAPVSRSVSVNRTAHQTRTMRSGHEHRYRLWGAGLPSDSSPSLP